MNRLKIVASIFGAMAAALVGPAVNKILSLATQGQWPQWTILFLILGGSLFTIALLILIPLSWWKWIGRLFTNLPRNLKTIYWLQSVLSLNKDNIYTAVKSRFSTFTNSPAWDFTALISNPLDPYFKINLELINTSIFDICITGIEGQMIIDGTQCQKEPKVDRQYGIKQGDIFYVTISQPVSDLIMKRIKDVAAKNENMKFDLNSMSLVLETTTKGYEGYKIRVKFSNYKITPVIPI